MTALATKWYLCDPLADGGAGLEKREGAKTSLSMYVGLDLGDHRISDVVQREREGEGEGEGGEGKVGEDKV